MKRKFCENIYKKEFGYCRHLRFHNMSDAPWCSLNNTWVENVSFLKCKPHKEIKLIDENKDVESHHNLPEIPDGCVLVEKDGVLVPVKIVGN